MIGFSRSLFLTFSLISYALPAAARMSASGAHPAPSFDGAPKASSTLTAMSYEELNKKKGEVLVGSKPNKDAAIRYLDLMIPKCTDTVALKELHIERADLLYDTAQLTRAETQYREFAQLNPSDSRVEHAVYRAILCSADKINEPDRDQSKTRDTLALVETFLEEKKYTAYIAEVQKIKDKCYDYLIRSEFSIFDFYLKQHNVLAAFKRLENIEKEYAEKIPAIKPQILEKTCLLAEKQGNAQLLELKQLELKKQYPEYTPAQFVHAKKRAKSTDVA